MIEKEFIIMTNKFFEEEMALVEADTNKVVLIGDYYHDSIKDKIQGFIEGLEYCGYKVKTTDKWDFHEDFEVPENY